MKKVKGILIILLIFIIINFLQVNFFSWFTIRGIKPNLFILLILFLGLFTGKKIGSICGFIFGFIIDLLIGKTIGFTSIFLGLIGLLGEYFDKNFSKDSRLTIILMTVGSTVIFEICMYIVNIIKFQIPVEILPFILTLLIETIYNVFIVVIIYPGMKKLGYYLENIFKNKKLLTRYF